MRSGCSGVQAPLCHYRGAMPSPAAREASHALSFTKSRLVRTTALLLAVTMTGCGSEESTEGSAAGPDQATTECRDQWQELSGEIDDRARATHPSALTERWTTIEATVAYYSTSATESDCGETMDKQRQAMTELDAFSAQLARYDMELRLEDVESDAEVYAANPRPPAPKAAPAKKGKKNKGKNKPKLPPKPTDIASALKTLDEQAPLATEQQGPAWAQARVTDLDDEAAVKKAIKDLAFLSSESAAYRASAAALAKIDTALAVKVAG